MTLSVAREVGNRPSFLDDTHAKLKVRGVGVYVTPHMVTNFFQEWAVPIWEIFVFPIGDPHMVTGIPVW
jgi:hypothetical protein